MLKYKAFIHLRNINIIITMSVIKVGHCFNDGAVSCTHNSNNIVKRAPLLTNINNTLFVEVTIFILIILLAVKDIV